MAHARQPGNPNDSNMHVAYIHQHFATRSGASGTRSYEMSQCLLRAGHRVTMICGAYETGGVSHTTDERVSELDIDGIRVLRVAEPYANRMGFARRLLAFARFARTATKIVSNLEADLVFATSTPLTVGIPGMKGARRLRVPFVFEVRDIWPEGAIAVGVLRNPALIWYARRLERRLYHAADRIIALAPGIKDTVVQSGYPADKVKLIPNCSELDLFKPTCEPLLDERFGSSEELRLVFTGAHGLVNGLDAVLDAIGVLKERNEKGVRFVFIGSGAQRNRLIERSRCEGIESMISWIPSVAKEELAEILPRMDVGLMILRNLPVLYYGTSPNKFFDYIAGGLAVLNNYPGWLAELIEEHQCGRVVPPDDPPAFADVVLWLRDHRNEVRAMGLRARSLAEARFSRDRLGNEFVKTLEETL